MTKHQASRGNGGAALEVDSFGVVTYRYSAV